MSSSLPSPRVRTLSAALKRVREAKKVGLRELARGIDGLDHSQISHWESGRRIPSVEWVTAILEKLGVEGEERDHILALAQGVTDRSYLVSGPPGMSAGLTGVLECERAASVITEWSQNAVPGLLHTPQSARTILSRHVEPAKLARYVDMRLSRQEILTRPAPVEFHAIIHANAINVEIIGTSEEHVDQLKFLAAISQRDNVTVQIVQPGLGWHAGLIGPFVIYEFPAAPPMVYIEHYRSSAFLSDSADVEDYRDAARHLRDEVAMTPEDSDELLRDAIARLERTR